MENKEILKYAPETLIALVAILGIVAFFSLWYGASGEGAKDLIMGFNGIGFLNNADGEFYAFVPLLIMILGIIALIVEALPHFGVQMDAKVLNGIIAVIGLLMIILFFVFFLKESNGEKMGDHLQLGAWLGLLIGIITIAVGGFGIYKAANQ